MRRRAALLLTLLLSVAAPAQAQLTSPSSPPDPGEAALQAVPVTRVVRPAPPAPDTPPALNASITVRYGPAQPRAVLLLMPGYLGGASSFDRLARQIVALDPGVAVWSVDRRSNLLEDHSSLAHATPAQLEDMVRRGLPVRPAAELTFMQHWGLDVTLRDWRTAVLEARTLTPHVFLGGHSMGAALAGLYAAYDFGGQPGHHDVRGLIMLDGTPNLLNGKTVTANEYDWGFWGTLGPISGRTPLPLAPYVNTFYYSPGLAARGAAQARLAQLAPLAPAPQGGLTPHLTSNLAAAMLQLEQRYALLPFLAVRTGQATGTREVPNPLPRLLGATENAQTILGAQPDQALIGWQADPALPTDPQDFVNRFWTPLADETEWYFPQRLTLDVSATALDTRGTPLENILPVWHTAEITVPVLGIAAGRGVTQDNDYRRYGTQMLGQVTTHTLPDAAHLDVVAARSAQVARWILDWLRQFPT